MKRFGYLFFAVLVIFSNSSVWAGDCGEGEAIFTLQGNIEMGVAYTHRDSSPSWFNTSLVGQDGKKRQVSVTASIYGLTEEEWADAIFDVGGQRNVHLKYEMEWLTVATGLNRGSKLMRETTAVLRVLGPTNDEDSSVGMQIEFQLDALDYKRIIARDVANPGNSSTNDDSKWFEEWLPSRSKIFDIGMSRSVPIELFFPAQIKPGEVIAAKTEIRKTSETHNGTVLESFSPTCVYDPICRTWRAPRSTKRYVISRKVPVTTTKADTVEVSPAAVGPESFEYRDFNKLNPEKDRHRWEFVLENTPETHRELCLSFLPTSYWMQKSGCP